MKDKRTNCLHCEKVLNKRQIIKKQKYCSFNCYTNYSNLFRLWFAHNESISIGNFIYKDNDALCLHRKKAVFISFKSK